MTIFKIVVWRMKEPETIYGFPLSRKPKTHNDLLQNGSIYIYMETSACPKMHKNEFSDAFGLLNNEKYSTDVKE